MKTLIKNGKYLTPDCEIKRADILIEDGFIRKIGNITERADCEINAADCLAAPPFYNCHTHSAMTLLRGYAEDLPLLEWLRTAVFPFEEKMSDEDVYWGTMLAIAEYVRGGTVAAADMYFHAESVLKAADDSGFHIVSVGAVSDIASDTDESLVKARDLFAKYGGEKGGFRAVLGYHAEYTASDRLLDGLSAITEEFKAPCFAHVSESAAENGECAARCGVSPLRRAFDKGVYKYGGGAYHFVHPIEGDAELLASAGIAVITNPSSNLKLSSGIAPVRDYLSRGIKVALGTDGAASNNALDMFRERYLLAVLQKAASGDAAAVPVKDALDIASRRGAELMFGKTGVIAEGACADLVLLDLFAPNLQPEEEIAKNLVFSAGVQNVRMTMANGKILYRDGQYFIGRDIEEILSQCRKISLRIKAAL